MPQIKPMTKILFAGMLCAFLLFSCTDDAINSSDFEAGETFTDSKIRVVLIDTMKVNVSTIKFDSLATSSASRILVGSYQDSIFGKVRTSSFFEMSPSSYTIDTDAVYDSIVFFLNYDGYFYNDTLTTNTIHVKRLNKTVESPDGSYFYNTSTTSYDEEDLGSLTYYPRPLDNDSLQIKLSDTFGEDLYHQLQDKVITNSDEFLDYFKGISLQPDDNDASVIGFSNDTDQSFIRLYYSVANVDEVVESYIDLNISSSATPPKFYNNIITENPNQYIQELNSQRSSVASADSGGSSYIQCGTGISTKIEFPNIKTILDIPGQGTLLSATLKIRPTPGSYNDHLILRDSLQLYAVDQNNDITEQLVAGSGSTVNGVLNTDEEEYGTIYYEINLDAYIEKLLTAERDTGESIILLPSNYSSTVDRFVLEGNGDPDYEVKLEVIYTIYDDEE